MGVSLERGGPIRPQNVETAIFTATNKCRLKRLTMTNGNTSASTFNVWIVPDGEVSGATNRIAQAYPIAARDIILWDLDTTLYEGDALVVSSPTSSNVVFVCDVETGLP